MSRHDGRSSVTGVAVGLVGLVTVLGAAYVVWQAVSLMAIGLEGIR